MLPRNTAFWIAITVSNAINFLENNGVRVISVCSDNSSTNIASMDGHQYYVKFRIGEGIIRIPCFCHAVDNALIDVFGENGKYKAVI